MPSRNRESHVLEPPELHIMGGALQGWTIQGFMGRVMIDTQQGGGSYVGGRWAPAGLRVRAARASATYARRPGFALLVLGVTLLAHAGCGSQPTDNNDTDISVRQLTELANNAVPFEQDPVILGGEGGNPLRQPQGLPGVVRTEVAESRPIAVVAHFVETRADHIIVGQEMLVVPGKRLPIGILAQTLFEIKPAHITGVRVAIHAR